MARARVLRGLASAAALAGLLAAPGVVAAGPEPGAPVPVAVYVNVDELSALWPFRDTETGAFPAPEDPKYAAFREAWSGVIAEAVGELRRRMPKEFLLFPARSPEDPYAMKIDVWVADLQTGCGAPTFYKYLWVRTHTRGAAVATNWDGLGVRSDTLVDTGMPPRARDRADAQAWVELWSRVPYLHLRPLAPGERAAPGPDAPGVPAAPDAPPAPPVPHAPPAPAPEADS